ncbi:hypothetical protein HanIR_Chr08g0378431 [Helianthus annuus]|nr:hypothetical protein HanIR_Chr08g0378431 [Helianthus annuus]
MSVYRRLHHSVAVSFRYMLAVLILVASSLICTPPKYCSISHTKSSTAHASLLPRNGDGFGISTLGVKRSVLAECTTTCLFSFTLASRSKKLR